MNGTTDIYGVREPRLFVYCLKLPTEGAVQSDCPPRHVI